MRRRRRDSLLLRRGNRKFCIAETEQKTRKRKKERKRKGERERERERERTHTDFSFSNWNSLDIIGRALSVFVTLRRAFSL
jgi:ribosome assembly protein YihI (activator of Der GTPase)